MTLNGNNIGHRIRRGTEQARVRYHPSLRGIGHRVYSCQVMPLRKARPPGARTPEGPRGGIPGVTSHRRNRKSGPGHGAPGRRPPTPLAHQSQARTRREPRRGGRFEQRVGCSAQRRLRDSDVCSEHATSRENAARARAEAPQCRAATRTSGPA